MTKDEALKLALKALEDACGNRCNSEYNPCFQREAITAIKAALAQPEYDYKDLYEKEKRKSAMWLAKYEEVAGSAPKAIPMAQPEEEPVACVEYIPCCTDQTCPKCKAAIKPELVCVCGAVWEGQELIYTPPQRTWVGLTRMELIKCGVLPYGMSYELYEAIEQALKERNT